jgi:protein-L-isoaspartate(D-aspartate) O-methyltransferase
MVLPLGPEEIQQLSVIDKQPDGQINTRAVIPVRFGQLETVS